MIRTCEAPPIDHRSAAVVPASSDTALSSTATVEPCRPTQVCCHPSYIEGKGLATVQYAEQLFCPAILKYLVCAKLKGQASSSAHIALTSL